VVLSATHIELQRVGHVLVSHDPLARTRRRCIRLALADHAAEELGEHSEGIAVFARFESGYANTVTPREHSP
jgi:hypothetical protein